MPHPAQGFQRFQNAGQALFPRAFAFEAGFYGGQAQGGACAGQQQSCGADLGEQGVGPGGLGGLNGDFAVFGSFSSIKLASKLIDTGASSS
jgi:hypothetical protein